MLFMSFLRSSFISLTCLISLSSYHPIIAQEYESWVGTFDPEKHCNVYEVHNQRQGAEYDNRATVNDTIITESEHSNHQVSGSNTGSQSQSVDLIRQQDCSVVIQSEAHRYGVYQQTQTTRYIHDTQTRQNFLGNLLAW
jgi:hypothetical protein